MENLVQEKPEIVFVFAACMGGVSSFNYNIINHSTRIKNFYSKVILLQAKEDKRPPFTDRFDADKVVTFNFSYKENQYLVQERLNVLLGKKDGAIVTDSLLTLSAAKRFGNTKTIFHLLHDYFYVNQNIQSPSLVDVSIAHSSFFSDAIFSSDPEYYLDRTFYIPYGVKQLANFPSKGSENGKLNLVFLGRIKEEKGVFKLFEINQLLEERSISVNWTIIGNGPKKDELVGQWQGKSNVQFHEPSTTTEVYRLLTDQDIFVFPTSFEGTPVSILECLANGVITIVNDLPGGIRDIVNEGIGFRCKLNDTSDFVNAIKELHNDRKLLLQMQKSCFDLAHNKYDIKKNADDYFECFENYKKLKRGITIKIPSMSRLDKRYFPNAFVKFIRNIKR